MKLSSAFVASVLLCFHLNVPLVHCDDEEGEFQLPEFGTKIESTVSNSNINDNKNSNRVSSQFYSFKVMSIHDL
jgi:hypothetical protein